jgi:hypothetical protein
MSVQPAEGCSPAESDGIFRAADGLALLASPVFAVMALLALIDGDARGALCGPGIGAPWSGMVTMYLLMCIGHLPPWLRLLGRLRISMQKPSRVRKELLPL